MTMRNANEGRIVLFFFHCLFVTDDRKGNDVVELFTLPPHSGICFKIVLKYTHAAFIDTFAHVLVKVNWMNPPSSSSRELAHEVGIVNIFLMLENQSKFLASLITRINGHPD